MCVLQIAILEYLEDAYPSTPLLPHDVDLRFKVREICEIIGSGIQPLQNLSVLQQFDEGKQKEWANKWITKGLAGKCVCSTLLHNLSDSLASQPLKTY